MKIFYVSILLMFNISCYDKSDKEFFKFKIMVDDIQKHSGKIDFKKAGIIISMCNVDFIKGYEWRIHKNQADEICISFYLNNSDDLIETGFIKVTPGESYNVKF